MLENLEVSLEYLVRRSTGQGWNIPLRTIPNHELVLVLKGEGFITIENNRYKVASGNLLYFHPGVLHSLYVTQPPYMVFFAVHFTLPANMEHLPMPDVTKLENPLKLEAMFRSLQEIYTHKPYLYIWRQNVLLQQIICEIFVQLHGEYAPANLLRVKKVIDHIHADPCQSISVQQLAQSASIKKSLFLRCFRQITGTSPLQYATQLRLEYARDLLIETTLPVAEVGLKCGFQDSFYFSRCFKKHFSLSPLQYRKANGEAQM